MVTNSLSGSAGGSVVQAERIGRVYMQQQRVRVVPHQLPPAQKLLVNRHAEKARVVDACRGGRSSQLIVVDGPPGAGKSTLALVAVREAVESFPDGEIYVDLRGRDSSAGVSEVVDAFLRALGIDESSLAWGSAQKIGLLRTLTHDRRMLILVDHVSVAEQVGEWLPDGPGCVVLLTSNYDLDRLRKHLPVRVEVAGLSVADGVELLAAYCGRDRIDAERDAAEDLVRACMGLPKLLEVVATRLANRRSLPIARLAAELAEARTFAALPKDVRPVAMALFDGVFDEQADQARRLYALLGVHTGRDLSVAAAAALLSADPEDSLEDLRRAHLVEWDEESGRVRLTDFAAMHAAGKADELLTSEGRELAVRRLVRHYLMLAFGADLAARGDRLRLARYDGPAEAADLAAEHDNLVGAVTAAVDAGLFAEAWQLCEALFPYFQDHGRRHDWVAVSRLGVKAAHVLGDVAAESRMRSQLARALSGTRDFDEAEREAAQGVVLAEQSGDQRLLAAAEEFAGKVCVARGAYDRGIPHFERALQINAAVGRDRGVAIQHLALAQARHLSGDNESALRHAESALALFESLDQPELRNRGSALLSKGKALGGSAQAVAALESAVELLRQAGARQLEADALEQLGSPEHLTAALEIYLSLGQPEAVARVAARLSP